MNISTDSQRERRKIRVVHSVARPAIKQAMIDLKDAAQIEK